MVKGRVNPVRLRMRQEVENIQSGIRGGGEEEVPLEPDAGKEAPHMGELSADLRITSQVVHFELKVTGA